MLLEKWKKVIDGRYPKKHEFAKRDPQKQDTKSFYTHFRMASVRLRFLLSLGRGVVEVFAKELLI